MGARQPAAMRRASARRVAYTCAAFLIFAVTTGSAAPVASADRPPWTAAELALLASMQLKQLPPAPADPSNAIENNPAAIALGKRLFADPRLSRNGNIACSSCHDPNRQFQDGRPLAQGLGITQRRTPSIAAAGHSPWQFWDGRKDSLWSQALAPLEDPLEHGSTRGDLTQLIQRHYRREFEQVFGAMPELPESVAGAGPLGSTAEKAVWAKLDAPTQEAINRRFANLGKAIGAYVKTLNFGDARFDRYVGQLLSGRGGATAVLTPDEREGLGLFIGKGRCVTCHSGPLFSDHYFHSTRVPSRDLALPDSGRIAAVMGLRQDPFNCLGKYSDAGLEHCQELRFMSTNDPGLLRAFKTPSLRNVALRPPYMHAGQLASLREVIAHYMKAPDAAQGPDGMVHKLGLNSELRPLDLTADEQRQLIDFLGTLSGPIVERTP